MISKITFGSTPYGCCRYAMLKEGAKVLFSNDVRCDSVLNASNDFESVIQLKSKVKNTIIHLSGSFSYEDSEKLNDHEMTEIAKRLLCKLSLDNHPSLCVRHTDKHPHFHLIVSRIDWDAKTYNDSFIKNRAAKACDEIEQEFGLTVARGHGKTIRHKSEKENNAREEIKKAVYAALAKGVSNYTELGSLLNAYGIELRIQYRANKEVNGLSFRHEASGLAFKGSMIDKGLSYKRLGKKMMHGIHAPIKSIPKVINSVSTDLQRVNDPYDDGVFHIEKIFKLNKSKQYER